MSDGSDWSDWSDGESDGEEGEKMSIKAIHTIKSKLKMSDADYRAMLFRVAGVTSSKLLTEEQDAAVIRELKRLETAEGNSRKTPQEAKIWALWLGSDENPGLSRYLPEEKRKASYLAGMLGGFGPVVWFNGRLRFSQFTADQARRAINALKVRLENEKAKLADVPF